MLALIIREIEDSPVYLLVTSVMAGAMIIFLLSYDKYSDHWRGDDVARATLIFSLASFLIFTAFGFSQMYSDKAKGISTFLVTHAVGRGHVFTARLIVGLLVHLLYYGAVTIAVLLLVRRAGGHALLQEYTVNSAIDVFLLSFACYCMGLSIGFTSNKVKRLVALVLTILLLSMIVVKGLGIEGTVLTSVVILASLVKSWSNYKNSPI